MNVATTEARWVKSSYSGNDAQGICVEAAVLSDGVGIRDSKDVGLGHLTVRAASWGLLIGAVKAV